MAKWKGFRKKKSGKSGKAKSGKSGKDKIKFWTMLLYVVILLVILVIIYVSYTALLPQLASALGGQVQAGQGANAMISTNSSKPIVTINYVKS